jgi:hypothetical protein
MKVAEENVLFHTSGVSGKFDYEVASTAKMMNMLSNSLYKDKIAAVLRELGTNARDSHIMAGQTRPFDVILPTRGKLELRIRDYGTGMTPEKLEKMYRIYGASDKTESNDFNGCMGIGSKAPFSYSTAFTSISYFDGKKYTYINAKDERGIPSLNRLNVEDTTEPNGLEIVVAVKSADVDEFITKAKRIYRPFPVAERPNIMQNGVKIPVDNHEYKMEGNGWAFRGTGDRWSNNSNSFIVMGCVEYPIDIQHFVRQITNNDSTPEWYAGRAKSAGGADTDYSKMIRMGLNLFCNIGDVEMDISREGLQYTKATVEKIKQMLDVALVEIRAEISQRFINCKTLWDARMLYRDLYHGSLRSLQEVIEMTKPEWKGQQIGDRVIINDANCKGAELVCFTGRGNDRAYKNANVYDIEPAENVKFIENDVDKGSHAGCTRLCNQANTGKVYLCTFDSPATKQKFIDILGIDPNMITLASALPKPPKQTRGPVEKVFKYQAATGRNYANRNYWVSADVDIEDGGFYVEISAWRPMVKNAAGEMVEGASDSIATIVEAFKQLGIKMPTSEIIGVKTIGVKKFRKRTDIWTDFFDWAKIELDKHLTQSKISEDVALVNEVDSISGQIDKFIMISKVDNPDAKVDSSFYKFTTDLKDALNKKQAMQAKISAAINVSGILGLKFDSAAKKDALDKQLSVVTKKYPMLELVERWHLGQKPQAIKHIADYINLVDNCCP